MSKFNILLADPPWIFRAYSDKGKEKSPEKHYQTMTIDDIKKIPVQKITSEQAGLYLWVPDTNCEAGMEVLKAWGFTFKSFAFTWYKIRKDLKKAFKDIFGSLDLADFDFATLNVEDFFRTGLGYNSRKQTEVCLYGTTKNPPKRKDKGVKQVIGGYDCLEYLEDSVYEELFEAIGQHSAKPKRQYDKIEALADGPYVELFARETRDGWVALGNEIDGKDIRDAINDLAEE